MVTSFFKHDFILKNEIMANDDSIDFFVGVLI